MKLNVVGDVLLGALPAILGVVVLACDRTELPEDEQPVEPLVSFDTAMVQITTSSDTILLRAEIAATEEQQQYGLMERPHLDADAGMLFVYDEPQDGNAGFWMYRTLIPLDIAFLDTDGRIVAMEHMQPCNSPNPQVCRTYSPGVPFAAALEVNHGYFERHGIERGDRIARVDTSSPQARP